MHRDARLHLRRHNLLLFLHFFPRKDKLFFVKTPLREGHAISDKLAVCCHTIIHTDLNSIKVMIFSLKAWPILPLVNDTRFA